MNPSLLRSSIVGNALRFCDKRTKLIVGTNAVDDQRILAKRVVMNTYEHACLAMVKKSSQQNRGVMANVTNIEITF